nr:ABC transporter ATP-binding protein [uncultured Agathobaculum sp.]
MYRINVQGLKKVYPLYKKTNDRIKEAFSLTGKKYHTDFVALDDVNFTVEQGECVGIIGVNGSGKSTLLKILTGILSPTQGTATVNGKVSALLELGAGFNPEYSGIENVYLNGMLMGFSKEEMDKKIDEIIAFADIGDFIHQPVKMYSSGMFVRLAFAVAISVEPDILIIDEALSVGDVFFQRKCYEKIKELAGKATVLIVSHDLNALTKFCKRFILMGNGKVVFDGEANQAITKYFKLKQGTASGEKQITSLNKTTEMLNMKSPKREQYSGAMNIVIDKYFYSINSNAYYEKCEAGDVFCIQLLVDSNEAYDDVIVGYQIRDKYGNEIFGETSLTSDVNQYALESGKNLIEFEFQWPEIREGDYFITLGIGRGNDVLLQQEECWINQAIHVNETTHGKTIFGIFNNAFENYSVKAVR